MRRRRVPTVVVGLEGLARAAEVETGLDRLEEPMPLGLRYAEQQADHLHRELGGNIQEEVERDALLHVVQQVLGPRAGDRPRRGGSCAE